MGRRKKGHLQRAPDYDSGTSQLAQVCQQHREQQEQQRRQGEQEQHVRQEQQEEQRREEQQIHQEQQERSERQDHPNWLKYCLIAAGIILVALFWVKYSSLVEVSLSNAHQQTQECLQRYDNVTCRLYEAMKSQLEDDEEVVSLRSRVEELQQKNAEEIQRRMREEALVLTKNTELQNLKEKLEDKENRVKDLEKRNKDEIEGRMREKKLVSQKHIELQNVKAENEKLHVAIKERDGKIDRLTTVFDGEKRTLQSRIAQCEREMEQKKSAGDGAGMVVFIILGVVGVVSCACIFSGKKM